MPQACSHCRQAGHKRGKCPSYAAAASATAASDTATRTCSHCRQAGHTRRLCPTLQAERGCSNCSLLGHTISRCPERAKVRRRNNTNAQAAVRQRTLDAAHTTTRMQKHHHSRSLIVLERPTREGPTKGYVTRASLHLCNIWSWRLRRMLSTPRRIGLIPPQQLTSKNGLISQQSPHSTSCRRRRQKAVSGRCRIAKRTSPVEAPPQHMPKLNSKL